MKVSGFKFGREELSRRVKPTIEIEIFAGGNLVKPFNSRLCNSKPQQHFFVVAVVAAVGVVGHIGET